MAEFTYQTRKKLKETWIAELKKKGKHLSAREIQMLPEQYYYTIPRDACNDIRQLLQNDKYKTLSDLYRNQFPNLVDVCVAKSKQDEFYYALDEMNRYQMTAGWYRRSLRSESYAPFAEQSVKLIRAYAQLALYGGDLADVLTGNLTPELYDHARSE